MSIVKEEARKIIDAIPDNATWDDIMYEFYVRQKLETAIEEADRGNVVPHEDVKKRFLKQLSPQNNSS
jgi:predicted transcriptional regulator